MSEQNTIKVFDIQGYSVHDGPGIRQTIFLQGCPLKCIWCHSPESQSFDTKIIWLSAKCIGCRKCTDACPTGARTPILPETEDDRLKIFCDWDKCTNCGACEAACPVGALYYCGTERDIGALMHRIERETPYYGKSGGGVTVSGGEALCQPDGVAELLKRCKELNISTAVDTCGFIPYKNIEKVLPYADLFLFDIKHMDSKRHEWGTGVPNELILENARKIAEAGGKFHIRLVLIPKYNMDMENLIATRDFLLSIEDAVELIQVLPYHNFGNAKYDRLSLEPPAFDTRVPTKEEIADIVKFYEDAGFYVIVH